jgi:replicative DNA helicase
MRFTGMTKQQLRLNGPHAVTVVQNVLQKYRANIIIKQWPTGQATWQQVRSNLRLWQLRGMKFGVAFVDYISILKCVDRAVNDYRFKLKHIAEGLRAIAMEFGMPLWSAAQIRRNAEAKDTVGWQDTGESVEIPNTADVVITVNQTDTELAAKRGRIFVSKNRDNPAGAMINVAINPEVCRITEAQV